MSTPAAPPEDRSTTAVPMLLVAAVVVAEVLLALALITLTPLGGPGSDLVATNLGEAGLAAAAAVTPLWYARRCTGRRRAAWTAIGIGCGGWAAGQAVWSWYELAGGVEVPFPSIADAGFLVLPIAMTAGLWLYPARAGWRQNRRLLDALTVTAALTLVSWSTVLRAVVAAGADDSFALAISVAYPAGDLVVLVMVVLVLGSSRSDRLALGLVAAGLVFLGVADSAFAYLEATSGFSTGVVDLGWMTGFGLIALAPFAAREQSAEHDGAVASAPSLLPYLAVVVAAVLAGARRLTGGELDPVELALIAVIVVLVLARQFATLRENSSLLGVLAAREAELRHQAFHDGLTGLANRALFTDRLEHALELHRSDRRPLAVLICDLDDFKVVNDTSGHAVGDELLLRVAERLRGALRTADTLARLGGDEFAVLLEHGEQADAVAGRMAESLAAPFQVGRTSVRVAASVGVAVVSAGEPTPTSGELLVRADTAMYSAKRSGKGRVRVHQPGMSLEEVEEQRMAEALRAAVAERRLKVVFQPVVDVATGRVTGLECLARWTWEGSAVPPSVFVPVAERCGLIADLTDLVLDLACAALSRWTAETGDGALRVGVNVAPHDLVSTSLPGRVEAALRRHGIGPDRLVLEVTEGGLLPDPAAARGATRALVELGVRLALDDFGVGYSSLAHLSSIPLHSLKIDRAFTAVLDADPDQQRFVRALLGLAADLGLSVVAEGVERPEQLAVLRDLGCAMAQGYLLARPLAEADVVPLLLTGVPAAHAAAQRA